MTNPEMQATIRNLKELKILAEELAAEITAAEDAIKAEMTARDVDKLAVGEYKVNWTEYTSKRFDSKAFKLANPAAYDLFTKETATRRFSVN